MSIDLGKVDSQIRVDLDASSYPWTTWLHIVDLRYQGMYQPVDLFKLTQPREREGDLLMVTILLVANKLVGNIQVRTSAYSFLNVMSGKVDNFIWVTRIGF